MIEQYGWGTKSPSFFIFYWEERKFCFVFCRKFLQGCLLHHVKLFLASFSSILFCIRKIILLEKNKNHFIWTLYFFDLDPSNVIKEKIPKSSTIQKK